MIVKNPVTNNRFELTAAEASFFRQALEKFHANVRWSAFENFAFNPRSPIYARRKSYGKLTKDPLYRALQDMWLQLGVNQGEIQDDRPKGGKTFCREEDPGAEPVGQVPVARTVLR
jgi:hypothetical protein